MPPHGPNKLQYAAATTNVYFSGNSIVAGNGLTSAQAPPGVMGTLAPLAAAGLTVANLGHSGDTWEALTTLTDMDSAFAAGKTNVLLAMETVNSLNINTVEQCIVAAKAYIAARLAAHPTVKIVLVTAIPYTSAVTTQAIANADIISVNQAFLANHRAWGCAACVDLRATGSPFDNFSTYAAAEFTATGLYQSDGVHPNAAGAALIAQMCVNRLRLLAA